RARQSWPSSPQRSPQPQPRRACASWEAPPPWTPRCRRSRSRSQSRSCQRSHQTLTVVAYDLGMGMRGATTYIISLGFLGRLVLHLLVGVRRVRRVGRVGLLLLGSRSSLGLGLLRRLALGGLSLLLRVRRVGVRRVGRVGRVRLLSSLGLAVGGGL